MDKKEANTSNAPIYKRQNTDDDNEAGPSTVVAANPPNPVAPIIKQTGDIFKLDIDCFEESFDYLPLEGLSNVGKTCKRLQQVAGYCFQQNYSGKMFQIWKEGIDLFYYFAAFVEKIWVSTDNANYFVNEQSKFHRLKEIEIFCGFHNIKMFNLITTKLATKTLGKLEVLRIEYCKLGKNFHETTDQCVKLKRLEIDRCETKYGWLDCNIPTLEHFKIVPFGNESIEGIPTFLKSNPNIRKFATTSELLLKNRDEFMSANVKLDDLAICSYYGLADESMCNLLNALHERGFYKKLQLYIRVIEKQEQINQLVTIKGLVKLFVGGDSAEYAPYKFSSLKNLEELYVHSNKLTYNIIRFLGW